MTTTTKSLAFTLAFLVTILAFMPVVYADEIVTDQSVRLLFNAGDTFAVQDILHAMTINFTVDSGTLDGFADLTVNSTLGELAITAMSNGVLSVAASTTNVTIAVNGLAYAAPHNYTFGQNFTITWIFGSSYVPIPTPPIQPPTSSTGVYYFRSDLITINNVTSYYMHSTNTMTTAEANATAAGNQTVSYGVRVYALHSSGTVTEITNGVSATVSRVADGVGQQNGTLNLPSHTWTFGYDSLRVTVYTKLGASAWTALGSFTTEHIYSSQLLASNVTVTYYSEKDASSGSTVSTVGFGSNLEPSFTTGITFKESITPEYQNYYLSTGDLFAFVFYGYTVQLGANLFYGILALASCVTLYVRYKRIEVILLLVVMFGGSGGIFNLLIGEIGIGLAWLVATFGLAALLYRMWR